MSKVELITIDLVWFPGKDELQPYIDEGWELVTVAKGEMMGRHDQLMEIYRVYFVRPKVREEL